MKKLMTSAAVLAALAVPASGADLRYPQGRQRVVQEEPVAVAQPGFSLLNLIAVPFKLVGIAVDSGAAIVTTTVNIPSRVMDEITPGGRGPRR